MMTNDTAMNTLGTFLFTQKNKKETPCQCMIIQYHPVHHKFCIFDLAGGFKSSETYLSIGMILPNRWENNKCSSHHQPVIHRGAQAQHLRQIQSPEEHRGKRVRRWPPRQPWHGVSLEESDNMEHISTDMVSIIVYDMYILMYIINA